jgi:hypothetical protein
MSRKLPAPEVVFIPDTKSITSVLSKDGCALQARLRKALRKKDPNVEKFIRLRGRR